MATFKAVVFNSKNGRHIKADGTTNIKIKVYHNSDTQYISTDYYIDPKDMDKSGEVLPSNPEADNFNFQIGEIIQNYRRQILLIGSAKLRQISCVSLNNFLKSTGDVKNDYIDFVSFSSDLILQTSEKKTATWYRESVGVLKWYFKKEKIDTKEITSTMLNNLIKQLKIEGQKGEPLESGTINKYLRGIRAVFNKAKLKYNDDDMGVIRIPHDPFKKVKLPQYRRKRKNISVDELKQIKEYSCTTFREQLGQDVFLMLFYLMGINIKDLFELRKEVYGRIEYKRSKTDTEDNINAFILSIKVEPELRVLFDKYSDDNFLSEIKNRYSDIEHFNKAVNIGLKSICESLNITKVTTNWARHTWASIARNKVKASKADVDFCLGHVNNDYKMADIYIEPDFSIYDEINRDVLDLIK